MKVSILFVFFILSNNLLASEWGGVDPRCTNNVSNGNYLSAGKLQTNRPGDRLWIFDNIISNINSSNDPCDVHIYNQAKDDMSKYWSHQRALSCGYPSGQKCIFAEQNLFYINNLDKKIKDRTKLSMSLDSLDNVTEDITFSQEEYSLSKCISPSVEQTRPIPPRVEDRFSLITVKLAEEELDVDGAPREKTCRQIAQEKKELLSRPEDVSQTGAWMAGQFPEFGLRRLESSYLLDEKQSTAFEDMMGPNDLGDIIECMGDTFVELYKGLIFDLLDDIVNSISGISSFLFDLGNTAKDELIELWRNGLSYDLDLLISKLINLPSISELVSELVGEMKALIKGMHRVLLAEVDFIKCINPAGQFRYMCAMLGKTGSYFTPLAAAKALKAGLFAKRFQTIARGAAAGGRLIRGARAAGSVRKVVTAPATSYIMKAAGRTTELSSDAMDVLRATRAIIFPSSNFLKRKFITFLEEDRPALDDLIVDAGESSPEREPLSQRVTITFNEAQENFSVKIKNPREGENEAVMEWFNGKARQFTPQVAPSV